MLVTNLNIGIHASSQPALSAGLQIGETITNDGIKMGILSTPQAGLALLSGLIISGIGVMAAASCDPDDEAAQHEAYKRQLSTLIQDLQTMEASVTATQEAEQ